MFTAIPRFKPIETRRPHKMKPAYSIVAHINVLAVNVTRVLSRWINETPDRFMIAMSYPLRLMLILIGFSIHLVGYDDGQHGTAIAIVRTDEMIAVAADSRVVDRAGTKQPDECKILGSGGYYFTMHGPIPPGAIGSIRGFLVNLSGTLLEKAPIIYSQLFPVINTVLTTENPESGIVLLGVDNGLVELGYLRFRQGTGSPPPIQYCPGNGCPPNRIADVLVTPYQRGSRPTVQTIEDVRHFVLDHIQIGQLEEELFGGAARVGPPLQSLLIHRDGTHQWQDKADVCKDEP